MLAGGQSLVPLMNLRLASPSALVDLNPVSELNYITSVDGAIRIGAMTRQRDVELNEAIAERCPLLQQASTRVGHFQIRNRGTLGGAIAHADPAAEFPAVLLALDGKMIIRNAKEERTLAASEFFLGPFTTAISANEILVGVEVPTARQSVAFMELSRRHGDFAVVAVGVALDVEGHRVRQAGIALAGVGPTPIKPRTAEALLADNEVTDELFQEAATAAVKELEPSTDLHGTAEFRASVARTLIVRALCEASGVSEEA